MKQVDWLDFPAVCLEMVMKLRLLASPLIFARMERQLRLMPVDVETLAAFEAGKLREMDLSVSGGQG